MPIPLFKRMQEVMGRSKPLLPDISLVCKGEGYDKENSSSSRGMESVQKSWKLVSGSEALASKQVLIMRLIGDLCAD